jgi:lipoate-protein ligase A
MKRKQVNMLLWINDIARNDIMNMALDELIFNEYKNRPVLRTYCWDNSYTTIGYFQKVKDIVANRFIRRFTGGLTVNHHDDISYSLVVSSKFWDVYNQHTTYRNIHLAIKKALEKIGISTHILDKGIKNIDSICIYTFCENDLVLNGEKVVGSCLRRRRNKLIVQGSIHINLNNNDKKNFPEIFAKNIAEFLKTQMKLLCFEKRDIIRARKITYEKYSNHEWNNKF